MRTPYEYSASDTGRTTPTFKQQSAIPYHARENSLPFSYGQIGTTSTPLRSTANAKIGNGRVAGGGPLYEDNNYSFGGGAGDCGGAGMLKPQPRLTSPILVRKTLSRSPTRSAQSANTNTIANIYQFKYGDGGDSGRDGPGGDNYSPNSYGGRGDGGKSGYGATNGLNGYISPNNQHFGYGSSNSHNSNTHTYSNYGHTANGNLSATSPSGRRTPARNEFDELLRERRDKVYSDYQRATTHDLRTAAASPPRAASPRLPPQPPQRQWHLTSSLPNGRPTANGSTATRLTETTTTTSTSTAAARTPQKYNYDFEFNLNLLDELDGSVQLPRGPTTMERNSSNSLLQQQQHAAQKQQQLQQYRTRDIPLPPETQAAGSYVERNYHTISSQRPGIESGRGVDAVATTSYTYQQRQQQQPQPQPQPRQPQHASTAAYGNENVSGYGYNGYSGGGGGGGSNINGNGSHINGKIITTTEKYEYSDRGGGGSFGGNPINNGGYNNNDVSPIYATTTKQTARRNIANNVNFNNNNNTSTTNSNYNTTTNGNGAINNMATLTRTTASTTTARSPTAADYPLHGSSLSNVSIISRPETPAFPTTPRTPFSSTLTRSEYGGTLAGHHQSENIYQTTYRPRLNSSLSMVNSEPQEVAAHLVKFAKDSSKFWYKPQLTRDEAIALLLHAAPGTFVVRDSTTYKNAYGLVVRVAQPPPGSASGKPDELVRHFLIEPTTRGVRLKGCANEPVFQSLSALVYEHSINQLALPCLLRIPEHDLGRSLEPSADQQQLMTHGAACNVLWLYSSEMESLTGEEAIRKTIRQMYGQRPLPSPPLVVHFKVTPQGITLTDNTRKRFFRKHYAADIISFCAIDPDNRQWTMQEDEHTAAVGVVGSTKKTIFAFVARRSPSSKDNQCHVFCDLAINQPASAIVSFVNKTLPTEKQRNYVL